jgi:hypothetical protein
MDHDYGSADATGSYHGSAALRCAAGFVFDNIIDVNVTLYQNCGGPVTDYTISCSPGVTCTKNEILSNY